MAGEGRGPRIVTLPERPSPLVVPALAFYACLSVVAVAVSWFWQDRWPWEYPAGTSWPWPLGVLAGLVAGGALVAASRWAQRAFPSVDGLAHELRGRLGHLREVDVAAMAIGSAVGEELLFRGLIQPVLGLVLTSVLFGLVHLSMVRPWWTWPIMATLAGVWIGGVTLLTGSLTAAVVAHATVNWINLRMLRAPPPR